MILVDTSVWIDHFRTGDTGLTGLLQGSEVLGHPWVVGELALGRLSARAEVLGLLANLPQATLATAAEVMSTIEARHLTGRGIGYVDAHLVASTLLTPGAGLWSRDKRLAPVAGDLGIAAAV